MRPADLHQSVADSLQADVMRFMAIIAFCLIAILALVRGAAPPADTTAAAGARPLAQPVAVQEPEPAPLQRAEVPPAVDEARVAPVEPEPAAEIAAEPAVEPETGPAKPKPVPRTREVADAAPARTAEPAVLPAALPVPEPPAPAAEPANTASVPAQEEGLSLRFASERDFLRLVTRGRIQVFAFDGDQVLALGANFSFQPAAPPGEVHELLPETIPALMTGALADAHGGGFRWGVTMPDAMARQIQRFVAEGATGELVIDRFGEVRHHGA